MILRSIIFPPRRNNASLCWLRALTPGRVVAFVAADRAFSPILALWGFADRLTFATHGKIDRGVSERLAWNIPANAGFQYWICCLLPRVVDRGAVVFCPDPAGHIFHAVYSSRILRHRIRWFADRDRDSHRRRHARHDRQFQRRPGRFFKSGTAGDLSDRLRPHDMGHRALPIGRVAATGNLKAPDPGGGISKTRCRRASAPAEEQTVDRPRRSSSGAAGSTAGLG